MTPASTVGLGVKPVGVGFTGLIEGAQTWSRINSIPGTPNIIPASSSAPLQDIEGIGGNKSWDIHHINKEEVDDYIANSKTIKGKTPVSIPSINVETTSQITEIKEGAPLLESTQVQEATVETKNTIVESS